MKKKRKVYVKTPIGRVGVPDGFSEDDVEISVSEGLIKLGDVSVKSRPLNLSIKPDTSTRPKDKKSR